MRLRKEDVNQIKYEITSKYEDKLRKLLKPIKTKLSNEGNYLTLEQMQVFNTIPKEYMPKISRVIIAKEFIKGFSALIKNDCKLPIHGIYYHSNDKGFEIELDFPITLPAFAITNCGCNNGGHGKVIVDYSDTLKDFLDLILKYKELKSFTSNLYNFKTLKTLKENVLGIENLAPKSISSLDNSVSLGALVVQIDANQYVLD